MNKELTEIVLIIDRSGSMSSRREEAENSINRFIDKQKNASGYTNLTLVEFDNEYNILYDGISISEITNKYNLDPRGMTALFDTIGKTINLVGHRLSNTQERDRPGLVTVVIVTDGQENCSKEFALDKIKELISHQEKKYNWQFTYLGADQNSFQDAQKIGINSAVQYNNYQAVWGAVNNNITRMRKATVCGQTVNSYYTKEEVGAMKNNEQ